MSRIFTQLGDYYDLFRIALAYVLTMRGVPQIYYGTEILMSHPGTEAHGALRMDFPGGWPGDERNGFSGDGLTAREREARDFVRTLLHWRRDARVIHAGELTHFVPEDGTYVYFRHDDRDSVMVVLNKNEEAFPLELSRFRERLEGYREAHDVITGETQALSGTLNLPPRSVLVLELR